MDTVRQNGWAGHDVRGHRGIAGLGTSPLRRSRAGCCARRGRPQHRGHVAIPAWPHIGLVPVDGPAVVRGVDVAGEGAPRSRATGRARRMHLARQRGAVSQAAQVMGVGGHIGREVGGVVVGAYLGRQLAADQTEARGGTQGAVAVGGVEHHAPRGQRAADAASGSASLGHAAAAGVRPSGRP